MSAALIPLQNITLGSAAASVIFASIPGTMRDLRLVIDANTSSGEADLLVRYNSDTGSNYSNVYAFGSGSGSGTSGAFTGTSSLFGYIGTGRMNAEVDIMDYSATNKHKSLLSRCSAPSIAVYMEASRWASTSAITSVQVLLSGNNFAAGSTFALYGVLA